MSLILRDVPNYPNLKIDRDLNLYVVSDENEILYKLKDGYEDQIFMLNDEVLSRNQIINETIYGLKNPSWFFNPKFITSDMITFNGVDFKKINGYVGENFIYLILEQYILSKWIK